MLILPILQLLKQLSESPGKCLINSVNGEERSLNALLPLAREFGAAIIGLCMDDDGITHDPEKDFQLLKRLLKEQLVQA